MKKAEAQELTDRMKLLFAHVLNVPVTIIFDKHTIYDTISGVIVDKVGVLVNAPEKEGGKTPTVISLLCEDSKKLVFVVQYTQIVAISEGLQLEIGDTVMQIRRG